MKLHLLSGGRLRLRRGVYYPGAAKEETLPPIQPHDPNLPVTVSASYAVGIKTKCVQMSRRLSTAIVKMMG